MMLRRSLKFLIAGAAVSLAAGGAQAGSACCDGCGPCAPGLVEEVVAPVRAAPFYIVDQGPVFYGPGVVAGPSYFEVVTSPHRFPYIGNHYYRPYDGGPYADPVRHHVLHGAWETTSWHRPPLVYRTGVGPRIITVSRK